MNLHISSMHECVRAHTVTVKKLNCTQGREIMKLLWLYGNAMEVGHERPARGLSGTSFSTGLLLHPRLNWSRKRAWTSRSCKIKWNLCHSCLYGYLQKLFILNDWTVVLPWCVSRLNVILGASLSIHALVHSHSPVPATIIFLASQSLFLP